MDDDAFLECSTAAAAKKKQTDFACQRSGGVEVEYIGGKRAPIKDRTSSGARLVLTAPTESNNFFFLSPFSSWAPPPLPSKQPDESSKQTAKIPQVSCMCHVRFRHLAKKKKKDPTAKLWKKSLLPAVDGTNFEERRREREDKERKDLQTFLHITSSGVDVTSGFFFLEEEG